MTSNRKVAANRRNAQKSTGPKTPSGKAIASMNALKHGLCSRKPLIPGENEAEFCQFAADWVDELRPEGPHQSLCAEQAILSAWQLRRVPQMEAGLLTRFMRDDGAHPFAMGTEAYQQLSRLDRHHAALQRTFDRSLQELRELQEDVEAQNEPTDVEPSQELLLAGPISAPVPAPGSDSVARRRSESEYPASPHH